MAPNTSQWAYDILQTYAPLFAEGQAYLTPNFGIPLQGIGDPAVAAGFAILDALAGQGSGSSSWSALTNPTTNLNLSMGLNSSTFDYAGVILTLTGVTATTNPPPTATYAGTITGGANNAYAGAMVLVEGFPTPENNGWWLCVSSTATQLVLANQTQAATIESASATAKITGVFNFANTTPASGFTEHQNSPALSFTGAAWNLPGVSDNDTWVVGSKITGGGSSQTSAFTLTHYGDIATSGGLVLEEIVAGTPPFISSRLFGVEYFNISATQNDGSVFNSKNYPLFLRSGFTNATNGPALGVTMGAMSSTTVDQVGVSLGVTAGGNNILFNPSSGAANGVAVQINAESNQTGSASGNFTAFAINAVKTSFLGTSFLVADFQIGGGSLLNVAQDGTHLFSTAFVEGQNFQFNSGSFITDTLGSTGTANQILTAGVGGDVVWGNLPSFGTLYLDAAASTIGGYASLITTYPTTSQTTYSVSGSGVGTVTLIKAFASSALNLTTIPAGMWTPSIYASVDSLTQNPQFQIDLYTRTSGGVETLQASLISTFTSTAMTLYTPTIELGNIGMNPTDLVVVKVSLLTQGASTRTATVYIDLTSVSHLHLPTSTLNTVVPWSSLANAQTNLTLANAGFNTTFNQTSAVVWKWYNTTTATSGTTNGTPSINLSANYWTGAASAEDKWTISAALTAGTNGNSILTVAHTGSTGKSGLVIPNGTANSPATPALAFASETNTGIYWDANHGVGFLMQGNASISMFAAKFAQGSTTVTGWCSTSGATNTLDTGISRISAALIGIGNGAAADFTGSLKYNNGSLVNATAATSGTSQSSPTETFSGQYWTGAASAEDKWTIQNVVGNGTNGTSSLKFLHSGSSGAAKVLVPRLQADATTNGGDAITLTQSGTTYSVFNVNGSSSSTIWVGNSTGLGLGISANGGTSTANIFLSAQSSLTATSGAVKFVQIGSPGGSGQGTLSFAPASGTATCDFFVLNPTINQTGGANGTVTDIKVNTTETAVVGTHNFFDLQIASSSKFTIKNSGVLTTYNSESTAGVGTAYIRGVTSQKSETGADASVLSVTPASAAGTYRINIVMSVSAANTATLGWTATWTDSNGTAQTPTNLALFKNGTAAPALTFSAVANDTYHAQLDVDVNNAGTAIVVMTTFSGTSIAYKVTATIERIN